MFLLCIALVKDLRRDPLALRQKLADSVVERAIRSGVDEHGGVPFELVTRHDCTDAVPQGRCSGPGVPTPDEPPAIHTTINQIHTTFLDEPRNRRVTTMTHEAAADRRRPRTRAASASSSHSPARTSRGSCGP